MLSTKLIGNRITEARKKINISQAQLAQHLFISSQAVGKWERGESMPDIVTLTRLAEIFGVDLNYFSANTDVTANETKVNDTVGNVEQTVQEEDVISLSRERQLLTDFSGSSLSQTDFAGVTVKNGKFEGSALRNADFSGADLIGCSFKYSDMHETNFDRANLTDCNFNSLDLSGARFHQSKLLRTSLNASNLVGTRFIDVKLNDVKITTTDLRKTVFENCIFEGVDFVKSDLRGLCLDGQTFVGVTFDNSVLKEVSFKGATLNNVAFRATHALTNKFYRAISTIRFDGAAMDKLSYNALKGMGADLSNVTIIM